MAIIEVISSCLVGMASMDATPMSRLELTPWDLQLLNLSPIQRGILFHKPESDPKSYILHLKNSFSRTLDFFPPLSGRLAAAPAAEDSFHYFLDCNNAGAEFTHAAAAVSVADIPEIVSDLFPLSGYLNCDGLSKPLIGVQVTQLADGLFIGCTANHAVVDGVSFWHFINSWSELSRGSNSGTISKLPVFERWFPSSVASGDHRIPLPPLEKNLYPPPPLTERVFHFSKESLGKLKSKAISEAGSDRISTLQALSAHLWRSTTRCRRHDPSSEEVRIMIAIGARARIPLPDGYFGNAFNSSSTAISAWELLQGGLGFAALKINQHIAAQTGETVIKTVENWMKNPVVYRKFPPRKRSSVVMITSSPRHNVYGNDFGWGKPVAAASGKIEKFDGNMIVYPAAVAGGVDVEVCLAPETMQAMEDDAEFMEAMAI